MLFLESKRLLLRPFAPADAPDVQRLADNRAVSIKTALLPYPYTLADAESWIGSHAADEAGGRGRPWAVTRQEDGVLMGAIGLVIHPKDNVGLLGYWLGQAHWGQGYATEAARDVVRWGFAEGLAKIAADVFATNPASIKVLRRCGLRQEGLLRSHVQRDGVRLDVHCYGRLREDEVENA